MEKYIEVKSLIDALEQRKKQLSLWVDKDSASQRIDEIDGILDVDIVSLQQEQSEVNLEKEIEEYRMINEWSESIPLNLFKIVARYFYGLGQLNSK